MNKHLLIGLFNELEKIAAAYGDMPASVMKTIRGGGESANLAKALRRKGVKVPKPSLTSRVRGVLGLGQKRVPPALATLMREKTPEPPERGGTEIRLSDLGGYSSAMMEPTEKRKSSMSSVFANLNKKHASFMTSFLDEMGKIAVYKPLEQSSLSSTLPGKIPAPGFRRNLAKKISPAVQARLKAVEELRSRRKPVSAVAGTVENLFDPESPAIRHRAGREHLAGMRAQAAGESYALGANKQRLAESKKVVEASKDPEKTKRRGAAKITDVDDPHYKMYRSIVSIAKTLRERARSLPQSGGASPE